MWDDAAKRGGHGEGTNDFEQNRKRGQGVADLRKDTFEDAVVNTFIWFLGLGTKVNMCRK